MTKADLVERVTEQISRTAGPMISKKDCARVVDAFLDGVTLSDVAVSRAPAGLADPEARLVALLKRAGRARKTSHKAA